MRTLPFYRKIIFKVSIAIICILGLSFSISYFMSTQNTNHIINKSISKEFNNALNITEHFVTIIGQTAQIWARHTAMDKELYTSMIDKDFAKLKEILKFNKDVISADSIILLDPNGFIISEFGSNYQIADNLSSQDIVKESLLTKSPISKITRERESFIIYSSSLIEQNNKTAGMILIGYFINDTFLDHIKVNSELELAFVGNSAIMSSTKWGGKDELGFLPIDYIKYQALLNKPNNFLQFNHSGKEFIITARKLKNIDSSISGSILIGHETKNIQTIKDEIFNKTMILFGSIFIVTLLILLFLSNKMINSIDRLKDSTLKIANGDLNNKVVVDTNDELDILAQNFNQMIDAIESKNKQLENYTTHLEDEVQQRTNELIEKEHILAQQSKMAAMGEMLENIAHQWRQPLSIISTSATGTKMRKELEISTKEEEIEALENINETAQYLSKTIDDFKNFFKPNKKEVFFNIKDVYLKTLNLINSKLKNKDIQIIESLNDITIKGLDNELIQVIMNLLNNAKDILETKPDQKKLIFVDIYTDNNDAIISIRDNGGGIPKKILNKIFEPYFTTKHKSQGTGIGLYMCEEIISKHMNGTLKVENQDFTYENNTYTGACFTIILPIK